MTGSSCCLGNHGRVRPDSTGAQDSPQDKGRSCFNVNFTIDKPNERREIKMCPLHLYTSLAFCASDPRDYPVIPLRRRYTM